MNPSDPDDGLAHEWDALLLEGLVRAPADFQARVMHDVQRETEVLIASRRLWPSGSLAALLQATAVLVAAIAAGWQTLGFVFGLWATALAV